MRRSNLMKSQSGLNIYLYSIPPSHFLERTGCLLNQKITFVHQRLKGILSTSHAPCACRFWSPTSLKQCMVTQMNYSYIKSLDVILTETPSSQVSPPLISLFSCLFLLLLWWLWQLSTWSVTPGYVSPLMGFKALIQKVATLDLWPYYHPLCHPPSFFRHHGNE